MQAIHRTNSIELARRLGIDVAPLAALFVDSLDPAQQEALLALLVPDAEQKLQELLLLGRQKGVECDDCL